MTLYSCAPILLFWSAIYAPQTPTDAVRYPPPSSELEALVVSSFTSTHDGWSTDEVLLNDDLRASFVEHCKFLEKSAASVGNEASSEDADRYCRALLHVRKRGGKLPPATRRSKTNSEKMEAALPVAEIAARRLSDELGMHTDGILMNSQARSLFDEVCESVWPEGPKLVVRRAALRLRKTRKLEPELLKRVTDWKVDISDATLDELSRDPQRVPQAAGIYIFRDATGYLYIGQASNLRSRLETHLRDSDRVALAQYLREHTSSRITVELHAFGASSPANDLRIRRAYESELIRTRRPKLNLAP